MALRERPALDVLPGQADGVPFEEVSLGYPREWSQRSGTPDPLRRILDGHA